MKTLADLMEGNKRFVEGKPAGKDLRGQRAATSEGQKPFATVVTCSDSRVAPEHIFDVGLGEIFVVRVAGNVLDNCAMGSVEYAIEHLHTPLLVVMGHEKCGAVAAACAGGHVGGNIAHLVEKIKPAVKKANGDPVKAGRENVKEVLGELHRNPVVQKLEKEGKLKLAGAQYYLKEGRVEII